MDNSSAQYQALSVFSFKYAPAEPGKETDMFTSKEIQQIVEKHTGMQIPLGDLHNLLRDMKYNYLLDSDEFKWLCNKADTQ